MAKKASTGLNWPIVAAVVGLLVVVGGGIALYQFFSLEQSDTDLSIASCLPTEVDRVRARSSAARRSPGDVDIYLDASGGMAGYVAQSPNVVGNLTTLARNYVQSSLYEGSGEGSVDFRKFGEYRFNPKSLDGPPKIDDVAAFARPGAYRDTNTHIADLLRWIVHHREQVPNGGLSVIVTDLMLDDRDAVDQFEASVGGILRNMVIEDGLTAGILAVRVPFRGKIFVGPQAFSANVDDRPLTILMIGSPYQVHSFHQYLQTSEIAPLSDDTDEAARAFALFGLEAGSIALFEPQISGISSGFSSRPASVRIPGSGGIRSVTYDPDEAERDDEGGIVVQLDANAGVEDFEVIGNEPLWESALWRLDPTAIDAENCAAGTSWMRVGNLPVSGWQADGQRITYRLTPAIMEQVGLDREGTYMIQFLTGQQGVIENHPAAQWMQDWSMSNTELASRLSRSGSTRELGVPGLDPLRNILITELMMPGREEIERSASQIIIETR